MYIKLLRSENITYKTQYYEQDTQLPGQERALGCCLVRNLLIGTININMFGGGQWNAKFNKFCCYDEDDMWIAPLVKCTKIKFSLSVDLKFPVL